MEGPRRRGAHPITFKYRAEKSKVFGVVKRPWRRFISKRGWAGRESNFEIGEVEMVLISL